MRSTLFSTPRSPLRAVSVLAACGLVVLVVAGPAAAHITTFPSAATQGGSDLELTFRVPNEEAKASTTKVEITFPADHPIANVLVQPVAGWTVQVQNTTLATPIKTDDGDVSQVLAKVTWSGGRIDPGQYAGFHVIFGLLPSGTDQIVFKAVQTYSNGDVVRWIDVARTGQPAPDHPAPVLALTKPTGASTPSAPAPAKTKVKTAVATDSTARGLGVGGLVVGVLGLVVGGYGLVRGRRAPRA